MLRAVLHGSKDPSGTPVCMRFRGRIQGVFHVQIQGVFRADFCAAGRHAAGEAAYLVDTHRARRLIGRGMLPLPLGFDDDVAWHQNLIPGDLDVGRRAGLLLRRLYHHLL